MSKVIAGAAMLASIALAIPTGGGSLLAVGIVNAGIASAAAAGTIATALSLGLSFVAQLTAKKSQTIEGAVTQWIADPNAGTPFALGFTSIAGEIRYKRSHGSSGRQEYLSIATVLSGAGPIDAITAHFADDEKLTLAGNTYAGFYDGRIWHDSQVGLCPEPDQLLPNPAAVPTGWTAGHKLSGYGAVMLTMKFDGKGDNTFTQVPAMRWEVRGAKVYDPRADDTYPGGAGPQRIGDQSTWAWSQNPWIVALGWALGWRQGPNNIRVAGVGMPIDGIDLPAFVEAANIADANKWTCGGVLMSTDDKWECLKAICQAGGGEPIREGAVLSCLVNAPRIVLATIGRGDVVGDVSATTMQPRRSRINGVVPRYKSQDHNWETVSASVVRNADWLAQDGDERTKETEYSMVYCLAGKTPDQAAQLGGYEIAAGREAGPVVLPLKLSWLGFKAGDVIRADPDLGELGRLAGQSVLVLRRQIDPATGGVTLTCQSETNSKHAWALGLIGNAPPVPPNNEKPIFQPPDEGDWSAVGVLDGEQGRINITGASTDPAAQVVFFEYRLAGDSEWILAGSGPSSTTEFSILGVRGQTYDVAVSYYFGARLIIPNVAIPA
jgi:hypothetical protein